MPLTRRTLLALTAVALVPGVPALGAGPVRPLVRRAPLRPGRTLAAVADEQLLAVTWTGGRAQVRARWRTAGGWTRWEQVEQDVEVGESARGTEPLWPPRGAAELELQVDGAPAGPALVRVTDGATGRGWGMTSASAAERHPLLGEVRTRADWGADESLRRDEPSYASTVRAVVVHHTAGSNDYAPADVPRRIRADYAYHVQARGWSDLGYNLVVDKYGGIWEGRAGGLGRATVGAHAAGFNTGTLGVSLLGDMTTARPTDAAVAAMSRVAAYAAATWRFDPTGTVTLTSKGSPRYASGTAVRLGRVHGHRDTGRTACPGALYDRLGDIRERAARLLGPAPQILQVTVTGSPVHAPSPMVLTGELNHPAPWVVEVHDADGVTVARATGQDARPHLEWNGLRSDLLVPAAPGDYTWHVRADDGVHPYADRDGAVRVGLPVVPV